MMTFETYKETTNMNKPFESKLAKAYKEGKYQESLDTMLGEHHDTKHGFHKPGFLTK